MDKLQEYIKFNIILLENTSDNNYKNLVYANGNIDVIKNIVSLNTEVNLLDF